MMESNEVWGVYTVKYMNKSVFLTESTYRNHIAKHVDYSAWKQAEMIKPDGQSFFTIPRGKLKQCIQEALNDGETFEEVRPDGSKRQIFRYEFSYEIGCWPAYNRKCKVIRIVTCPTTSGFEIITLYPQRFY